MGKDSATSEKLSNNTGDGKITPWYVYGYQLLDKVEYLSRECFVFGRRTSGYFDLRILDGEVISRFASVRRLTLVERAS